MGTATGIIRALNSGIKHMAMKRFTLRYPEEKLKFVGDGYQFDPSTGVGIAGLKGRHMLFHDHCTGCQLCSIACEGVAEAIAMDIYRGNVGICSVSQPQQKHVRIWQITRWSYNCVV